LTAQMSRIRAVNRAGLVFFLPAAALWLPNLVR
jgi:hypothetical protein